MPQNIFEKDVSGLYWCEGHGGTLEVRPFPHEHAGAVYEDGYEIEWADGMRVTVIDADVVRLYLENHSAELSGPTPKRR